MEFLSSDISINNKCYEWQTQVIIILYFLSFTLFFFVKFMDTLLLKEWVGVWENLLHGSVEVPKTFYGLNCDCLNHSHNCNDHSFISFVCRSSHHIHINRSVLANLKWRKENHSCIYFIWINFIRLMLANLAGLWWLDNFLPHSPFSL